MKNLVCNKMKTFWLYTCGMWETANIAGDKESISKIQQNWYMSVSLHYNSIKELNVWIDEIRKNKGI